MIYPYIYKMKYDMMWCNELYDVASYGIFLYAPIHKVNLATRVQMSTYAIVLRGGFGLSEGDIYCRPGRNVHGMLLTDLHPVRLVGLKKWKILFISLDWLCNRVCWHKSRVECALTLISKFTVIMHSHIYIYRWLILIVLHGTIRMIEKCLHIAF